MPVFKLPAVAVLLTVGLALGTSQDSGEPVRVAIPVTDQSDMKAPTSTPVAERAAYQSFFMVVAQLSRFVASGSTRLTEPSLQDTLGFTDAEMRDLGAVAADYEAKTALVGDSRSRAIFEARLREIEGGDSSTWLADQLKMLDQHTERVVAEHVQRVQRSLGAARFQTLSQFVRTSFAQRCFVAPCGQKR